MHTYLKELELPVHEVKYFVVNHKCLFCIKEQNFNQRSLFFSELKMTTIVSQFVIRHGK